MLLDEHVEELLEKYVKDDSVISFGTGPLNVKFLKKLAIYIEDNGINVRVVPTSLALGELCAQLRVKTESLDDVEIDVAFDFADQVNRDFDYISNETTSLIRDKMIAQEAAELIIVCEEENFVDSLHGRIALEINPFAIKKTLVHAMNLGDAKIRMSGDRPAMSETGNNFIDVVADKIFSTNDLEYQAKNIPGVLETSLFVGFADRILLHNDEKVIVKSRLTNAQGTF
jgi:ribose 5-phosphate isomerase A